MTEHPTPVPSPLYDASNNSFSAEGLAVQWWFWLRDARHRRPNTLRSYNQVLRFWLGFCDTHGIEPLRPTLTDLEAFMTRKGVNGRKRAPSSQVTDAAVMHGWFEWMHQRGHVPENPAFDLRAPEVKRRTGRPVEDEHWVQIWQSGLTARLRAILGLGFYCGLRQGEIGALRSSQVTPTRIVNFERKGGGEDTIPWMDMAEVHYRKLPHLLPDLDVFVSAINHVRNNHDRVIPWVDSQGLYRQLGKLCTRLEIPQYTPHQLRHSAATNLLNAGIKPHVVMRLMNHSSFDITMGYVRAGAGDLKEFLDNLD